MRNGPSGGSLQKVSIDTPLYIQRKQYEKEELVSSNKWDLVKNPYCLENEARKISSTVHRQVSNAIHEVISKAFSHSRSGTVAVLALGIYLGRLKNNVVLLNLPKYEREWGQRRERIRLLKQYQCTEHIFDHHKDIAQTIIFTLEAEVRHCEALMRTVAEAFDIQIPLKEDFTLFDDSKAFHEKIEKFMDEK